MKEPKKPVGRMRSVLLKTQGGSCTPQYVDDAGWLWSGPASSGFLETVHPYRIERAVRCSRINVRGRRRRR